MSSRARALFLSLAVAILVMGPVAAAAQPTLVAGLKGGVNSSTIDDDQDANLKQLLGGVGGVFVGADITRNFGIVAEGLYSQRGAKGLAPGEEIGDFTTDLNIHLHINYIDVPVLARVGTTANANGMRFFAFTGPQASFLLSAEAQAEFEGEEASVDVKEYVESLDFGWTLGLGLEAKRILVDARYTMGLRNMNATGESVLKNRTFTVMAGYRFK
jgi:hypothetical protein